MRTKNLVKNVILGFLVLMVVYISSCKKETTEESATTTDVKCYVTAMKDSNNVTTTTVEYNAAKKPIKVSNFTETGESDGFVTITYTPTTMSVIGYNADGSPDSSSEVYTLNANGYAVSCLSSYVNDGVNNNSTTLYEYNSAGYLIKETRIDSDTSITTYTITGGNVSQDIYSNSSGYSSTTTYTYYTDKLLKNNPEYLGLNIFGKSDLNPVKQTVNSYSKKKGKVINQNKYRRFFKNLKSINSDTQTNNYTYVYDLNGNIIKETMVSISSYPNSTPYTSITNYVYNCN